MGWFADFRKFAVRGNIVDLAVGFTVGAAFGTVAKSLVTDLIMPPVGLLLGGADFTDLFILLQEGPKSPGPYASLAEAQAAGAVVMSYGVFLNTLVSFMVVSLAMFWLVRIMMRMHERLEKEFGAPPPPAGQPADKKCPFCISTIPVQATRCPHCTSTLDAPARA